MTRYGKPGDHRSLLIQILYSKRFITIAIISVFGILTIPVVFHHSNSQDGGYTEWSGWSKCSKTCGTGIRGRTRNCTNPVPRGFGQDCIVLGSNMNTASCGALPPCPRDGDWNEWAQWSACVPNCENGVQHRTRNCDNPAPAYGGRDCADKDKLIKEERKCLLNIPCPINGGFSEWGAWTQCSLSCGKGLQERSRECNKPAPKNGGKLCDGHPHEIINCELKPCVVANTTMVPSSNTTVKL